MGNGYVGKLIVYLDTLEKFKQRVDRILSDIEASDVGLKKTGQDALSVEHLGTGFSEVSGLFGAYTTVHGNLEKLFKVMTDQVEAMSLLVGMARNDYQNVDEEQRRRLLEIMRSTQLYHDSQRRRHAGWPFLDAGQSPPGEGTVDGSV